MKHCEECNGPIEAHRQKLCTVKYCLPCGPVVQKRNRALWIVRYRAGGRIEKVWPNGKRIGS